MCFYILIEMMQMYDEAEFKVATYAGRAFGISEVLRFTKYYLEKNECYYPEKLLRKYGIERSILEEKNKELIVPEKFYDCVLEVAAYGKRNLQKAREMQS